MQLIAAAVVAAASLSAAAAQSPGGTCAADYACEYTYVDATKNQWKFDFKELCNSNKGGGGGSAPGGDYVVADKGGHNFTFNICGYASQKCLPPYGERYQYAPVIQRWDKDPPCPSPLPPPGTPKNPSGTIPFVNTTGFCWSEADSAWECCTQSCEVVGVGTPQWSLIDTNNPASGGVRLKYTSVPPRADDLSNQCGTDPVTTAPIARSITFNIACNRLFGPELVIKNLTETSVCQYEINATSGRACGCEQQCGILGLDAKICGSDGCGGYCSSPDLMGECPYANGVQQVCDYDGSITGNAGTCCRPDCAGRQCGSDGCGGSCGTCPSDESCGSYQVCTSNPNYPPQFAISYATDSGSLAGGFIGGILSAFAVAGAFVFFFRGGREAFDKWRFAAESGGSLLAPAAAAGAAGGLAGAAAGGSGAAAGGYGGLGSSGSGGYGATSS